MIKKLYLCCLALTLTATLFAQKNSDDVLFTIDNEPIKSSEFIRVYNKNLDLVKDESQKDVDAYLDLFVNYQLKIKEAKRLGLDTIPKYLREFESYKKQLSKNYLSDSNVTEALIKEAYDRSTQEVKASHILIRMDENEKDTLKVYNQLLELRDRVKKEGFETVQKEIHNGNTIFAEDLGWFSSFKMVYEFESAAFNTKVGEISKPFRTRFGYHVVKVDDKRPSRGEVTVAHIMISNKQADSLLNPETRINEIYKKINQGENFESLAKQFSDDKSSSSLGGLLSPFTGGQLSSVEFENMAFSLKEPGEISKPFKTDFGWHIVKLVSKKGVQPLEEVKGEIENKVKRDARSSLINSALAKKLKKKYNVNTDPKKLEYFTSILSNDFYSRAWTIPTSLDKEKELFKIGDKSVTYGEFAGHLLSAQKVYLGKTTPFSAIVEKEFKEFEESEILRYHEDHLEFENEDFAQILKEYRDGLLLFDLMEKEVWNAAVKDTVGLQKYYDAHKSNYIWKDRVDVVLATSAKKSDIEKVASLLKKGTSDEAISKQLNSEAEQKVIFTKGTMETDHQSLPKDLELKEGVSKIYNYNDAYHVLLINKIIPSSNKTFDEAKGKVISDYQNSIEENWLKSLHDRYKVEVDPKVLKTVKNQIGK
ncbi:peptidylprolyl isomerase [Subsaxibacter sp. CAU 1640]|uniref:peptidylprolyl isomerase n=1 Tax=Subsaxibacter sp. CAU 1640 TaxID=2933271 RepID=UPI00200504CC|nr:peptidylprolyl isomerase [Subsaxibacter sp. CAU 1640]MCK7589859.1 peptidylprolyl isomerase [Subsaxibacter sp. CAU 1640]